MTDEKKAITREKHPGRVAQGHILVTLNKKRKEKILLNKEQATVQATEQSTVRSIVMPNGAYVYGIGILAVLVIGVCVFFTYNTFQPKNKKLVNEKKG